MVSTFMLTFMKQRPRIAAKKYEIVINFFFIIVILKVTSVTLSLITPNFNLSY